MATWKAELTVHARGDSRLEIKLGSGNEFRGEYGIRLYNLSNNWALHPDGIKCVGVDKLIFHTNEIETRATRIVLHMTESGTLDISANGGVRRIDGPYIDRVPGKQDGVTVEFD